MLTIWTPAPRNSRHGNRITAERWARLLRSAGQPVRLSSSLHCNSHGPLLALHAVASRPVVSAWRGSPRIVVISGTDMNGPDLPIALETLALADKIVVLQPLDREKLPPELQGRTRVILPSVALPRGIRWRAAGKRVACSVGHLRTVKDPLILPQALAWARQWTAVHIGGEREPGWPQQLKSYSHFEYLGEKSHAETLRAMSRCGCFVLASRSEGCSNALCEAVALGMPVLASDIAGNRGLLGSEFPGYFPVGDARQLGELLSSADILRASAQHCQRLASSLAPERELQQLLTLL